LADEHNEDDVNDEIITEEMLWERIPETHGVDRASTYYELSARIYARGQYDEALALAETARDIYSELGSAAPTEGLAQAYSAIGYNLNQLKRMSEAATAMSKAVELLRENKSPMALELACTLGECRVVGIAGGKDKCDYVVNELGFDACIDYKQHADAGSLSKALRDACPNGIDGHFENVGGKVLDAVMLRTNAFARIAVCGMIAGYDGAPLPMAVPSLILINRMKIEGFIVSEHMEIWPEALQELGQLVGTGKLRPRESVAPNLASAPEAFLGLLKGKNFGKQLVKLI